MALVRFTILGCGASPGVPRITGDWGECDPLEPRNRRTRSAALIERFSDEAGQPTRVLIDAGPDLRAQLVDRKINEIHGVVFTHPHADHVHGIDDLRTFWMTMRRPIPVYSDDATQSRLDEGFGYCFESPNGSPYLPFLVRNRIDPGEDISISGPGGSIILTPFSQVHGDIRSLGYRLGSLAYSCDFNDLPEETVRQLNGLSVWILDALRRRPHPSHSSVDQALNWISDIKPERAILTHMTNELDYRTLCDELPPTIEPAYDGMIIEFVEPEPL